MGMTTKEVITEYLFDEETNKMKLVKKKVNEKTLPPNTDIIKLIYQQANIKEDLDKLSDEELEQEKQRLLKQLKEEENGCRKSKNSS